MPKPPVSRRKIQIVDAPTQARMAFGASAIPLLVMLAASVVLWFLSNRLFDEAQQSDAELPTLGLLTTTQFVFIVAMGAVVILEALRYSHKVVGPAMRICQVLRQMRGGDLDCELHLRKSDELTEVAEEVNALMAELRRRESAPAPANELADEVSVDSIDAISSGAAEHEESHAR